METKKTPLVTKGSVKVCLVLYAMNDGSQYQAVSVSPKEAKRMVNQFQETGKISFLDPSKGYTYDAKDKPSPVTTTVEPYSVVVSHVSDFYTKQA